MFDVISRRFFVLYWIMIIQWQFNSVHKSIQLFINVSLWRYHVKLSSVNGLYRQSTIFYLFIFLGRGGFANFCEPTAVRGWGLWKQFAGTEHAVTSRITETTNPDVCLPPPAVLPSAICKVIYCDKTRYNILQGLQLTFTLERGSEMCHVLTSARSHCAASVLCLWVVFSVSLQRQMWVLDTL